MKKQKTTDTSMTGRVCIVTGADSGIGFETSRQLARNGAHLVMVCKERVPGEAAADKLRAEAAGKIDVMPGDLSSLQEVRILGKTLLDKYPQIHVLINNAGIMFSTRKITVDGFESVFAVNYLAAFLLTHLLLDRMLTSAPARIINISSKGHRFGGLDLTDLHWEKRKFSGMRAYGASKIAINSFTKGLSDRLRGARVTVNAAHPGEVRSNIGNENGAIYHGIRKYLINRMLKPTTIAGEAIYYLAASPDLDNLSGKYFHMTHEEEPWRDSFNPELGKTLWKMSEEFTGVAWQENN